MTEEDQDQEAADALAELSEDFKKNDVEDFETPDLIRYDSEFGADVESSRLVYITLLIVAICIILSVLPTDRLAPRFIQTYFYANTIVKSIILSICVLVVLKTAL